MRIVKITLDQDFIHLILGKNKLVNILKIIIGKSEYDIAVNPGGEKILI